METRAMELDKHNEHPDEEALVLLFYGDTTPDEERAMTAHLENCEACQPAWQQIRTTLAAVDAAAVPEPPADFERVMWARVQGELESMKTAETPWWSLRHLVPAAGLAAVLLAMFLIGRYWPSAPSTAPAAIEAQAVPAVAPASQSERALLVAMDDHLERSELLLVELMNSPA